MGSNTAQKMMEETQLHWAAYSNLSAEFMCDGTADLRIPASVAIERLLQNNQGSAKVLFVALSFLPRSSCKYTNMIQCLESFLFTLLIPFGGVSRYHSEQKTMYTKAQRVFLQL